MNRKFTVPRIRDLVVLILFCFAPFPMYSQIVSAAVFDSPVTQNKTQIDQRSLEDVLKELQDRYKVSFIYESGIISNKRVLQEIQFNGKLEATIKELLEPLGLKFKKINDRTYVISPDKTIKPKSGNSSFDKKPRGGAEATSVPLELARVEVAGTVMDENDSPLPGVNVIERGTINGTTTDADGRFTLSVNDENSVLIFSFIGYESQELVVGNKTEVSISLQPAMESLQEVVVVGYGVQKKANLTGAVATVDAAEIEKLNVTQTSQLLTGQVAGVTVVQSSGQPGKEGLDIRIRGLGTFSAAGNNPLVLVDGLASSLDNVDFNDIATISVLKDAASASIYGARAANGVILIETKKGRQGKVRVNYHGYIGLQQPTETPKIVDSWVYAEMINEALVNDGNSPEFSAEDIAKFKSGEDQDYYPNKRHYDDLISSGSGIQTNHHLNVLGGTEKNSYMVSFGYLNQEGLIAETYFKRYNLRLNLDNKLSEKINLNVIVSGRSATDGEPTAVDKNPSLGVEGLIDYSIKVPNTIAGKMSNGYYGNQTGFTIEGWMDSESYISNDNKDIYANVTLDWNITKRLKLTGRTGYDYNLNKYEMFRPVLVVDQFITQGPSELRVRNATNALLTNQAFLNYDLPLENHAFHVLAGFSQESFKHDFVEGYRDNFPNNALYELNAGSQANQQSYGTAYEWALRSFFGRVTYNYKERYLFEANARYDGSSRFPKENRYGIFPSVSGGWRVSEEEFFTVKWIDELKFRASWGKLGNQNIGNYPYQQVLTLGLNTPFGVSEVLMPGAAATVVPNSNINWESTRVIDYGIDLSVLGGKLSLSADYYDKLTSGILYDVTASAVLGLTPSVQNAGMVSNKGIDLDVQHRNNIGAFSYSIGGNFSYVKNELLDLANVEKDIANGFFIGSSLQSIYGYEVLGLFVDQADIDNHAVQQRTPQPGTIKFKDISGPNGVPDGFVDADYDRKIIGNRFPKYSFGANLNAKYKGFDFSLLLQGVAGVDNLITGYQGNAFLHGSSPQQWMYEGRWTVENPDPNAAYPRLSILGQEEEQFFNSTYIMKDASFMRVNNVQIGYTFPSALVSKLKMSNLRIYLSAKNLYTFDHFREGWDPEMGRGYPPTRVYNAGINLNF